MFIICLKNTAKRIQHKIKANYVKKFFVELAEM